MSAHSCHKCSVLQCVHSEVRLLNRSEEGEIAR